MKKNILLGSLLALGMTLPAQGQYTRKVMHVQLNDWKPAVTYHIEDIDSISFSEYDVRDLPVNHIDYSKEIEQDSFEFVLGRLADPISTAVQGIWALRGGSDRTLPNPSSYWYQYSTGLDGYAQYGVVTHKDFAYAGVEFTSTYDLCFAFNGGGSGGYAQACSALSPLLNNPLIENIPELKAINLLFFDLGAQEMADLSGPFTYYDDLIGKTSLNQNYDPVDVIYYQIVEHLDQIIACLKKFDSRPEWYKEGLENIIMEHYKFFMPQADILYPGVEVFIKTANALKLRIAMNAVKAAPRDARKWAEEACADPAYIMTTTDDQPGLYSWNGLTNPLGVIQEQWNDQRLSASFESLLMSLKHPYVTSEAPLFKKNSGRIVNGSDPSKVVEANSRICGIRAGVKVFDTHDASQNPRINYSSIKAKYINTAPLYYIKLSEVDFLRAEAALRGWNVGISAQEAYENGIMHSSYRDPFELDPDWGGDVFIDELKEYMKLEKPVDYVNVDPYGDGPDWPSVTKIGVKWNESDSKETKLEKIITQKYIANYPNSALAWTDLRRTGYPKLFPVLNADDGDGSLKQGEMIRRVPWAYTDSGMQEIINKNAIPALGGPDEQATRLWWDVDAPNF